MSKLILIVLVQLIFVPLLTLRTITMVKNLKVLTAFFGFLEALVYIFGLSIVLSGDQSVLEMLVYALGFSMGLFAGIYVEQKMAIGFTSVTVNINHQNEDMIQALRDKGFGVTCFKGEGRNGARYQLDILTKRKLEKELVSTVLAYEPHAFIIAYEPKTFRGGYLRDMMKKRMNLRNGKVRVLKPETAGVITKTYNEVKSEVKMLKKTWKQ